MPLQELVSPWDQQPQESVDIDWGNPISRGLVVAFSAADSIDTVSAASASVQGSRIPTQVGIAISATGTQKAFTFADSAQQRSTHVSTFALLRRTATLASNFDAFGKSFQGGAAPSFVSDSMAYNPGGFGQNQIRANQGVSGGIAQTNIYTHPDTTRWHTAGGTFGDGSARLFVDGVFRESVASGAIAYGASGDNSFGANLGAKSGGFEHAIILRWARILSSEEFAALHANPWQIFQRREWVPFTAAAGGGVTGASSGTLALAGTAAGSIRVSGASAGTLALAGSSAGSVRVTGASSGTLALSGTATGTVGATGVTGASAGTLALTGTSTGTVRVTGAYTGALGLTGSATGSVRVSGASAGTLSLTGTATGTTTGAVSGASVGVLSLSGSATGSVRVSGGSAAVLQITGAAGAQIIVRGASAGVLLMSGSATAVNGDVPAVVVRAALGSRTRIRQDGAGTRPAQRSTGSRPRQ